MVVVFGIVGIVIALFVVAAVIDLKGRRRGVRYKIGQRVETPQDAANRAELHMRQDMGGGGYPGGF